MNETAPTTVRRARRFGPALAVAVAVSGLSLVWACLAGPMDIAPSRALGVLFSGGAGPDADPAARMAATVVLDLRLARAVLAWLTGAALGVSGAVFQGLLRNPLADPFTLGVSTGAAFGASLAIALGLGAAAGTMGLGLLPLWAMAGALGALGLVLAIGRLAGGPGRETLVLAGIIVATFLSALVALVKALNEESVASMVFWIMGSFQGRGWAEAAGLAPFVLVGVPVALMLGRELDILSLGREQAVQLGVDAGRTRMALLVCAGLMTGAAVAVAGVIGFVGLVVPHLVRLFQGAAHRPLIATSAVAGGTLLVCSDILARTVAPGGAELPVGVVTALIGGPFFCWLLARRRMGVRP